MFDRIGKNATIVARIRSARSMWSSPTQIRISGAIETIGVTWRITA